MFRLTKAFIVLLLTIFLFSPLAAHAVTGSDWRASNIIDDAIFYNNNDMSIAGIQNFLNSKVTCDTWGNKRSEWGGGTRAQYGASKGNPAPYTCLKDYSQDGKSAAQIIKEAADTYRISTRGLVVLLQKEQALITDEWPWPNQYRSATGYGCPDTAPCDSEYYGFKNQVNKAAYQFRRYATYPNEYRYKPYQNNYIQYNPASSCSGTNVYIQNLATAGLYNYTPYQPNASALSNLYGSGNSCGAYGNRNFWRLFNDWFGTTRADCVATPSDGNVYRLYNPVLDDYLFTTNSTESCLAQANYGYSLDGKAFSPTEVAQGGAPIFRMSTPSGRHFYTSSAVERDRLVAQSGFYYEGVAFNARLTLASGYEAVYRMSPRGNSSHFYTSSTAEKDRVSNKYTNEGIMFYAPTSGLNQTVVYRMLSPSGSHFYTTSITERNNAINNLGYKSEGEAFTVSSTSANSNSPVYRLISWPYHKFTPSINERKDMLNRGYRNETVAFYAAISGIKPVYRLYRHTDGDHLYTMSAYEKNIAVSQNGYSYEGASFYSY